MNFSIGLSIFIKKMCVGILIEIVLNLLINLERIYILIILRFLTNGQLHLHLSRSSIIFLSNALQSSVYSYFTFLVSFITQYFMFFEATENFNSSALLNSCIYLSFFLQISYFFCRFLQIYKQTFMSSANKAKFLSTIDVLQFFLQLCQSDPPI